MKNSLVKFFKKISFRSEDDEDDEADVRYASSLSYGVWKHSIRIRKMLDCVMIFAFTFMF